MPDLLVRNVSAKTVAALRDRARRHGTSVQAEVLALIEAGARSSGDHLVDVLVRHRAAGKLGFDLPAALSALFEDRSR